MPISATWTDPNALDLVVDDTLSQTIWEELVGNELWLYDLLTGAITTQEVSLARTLTSSPALSFPQTTAAAPSAAGFGGGLRMTFYDAPANDQAAYGIGVDANTLWLVSAGGTYKWYGAAGAVLMQLNSGGLTVNGSSVTTRKVTGGAYFNANPNIAAGGSGAYTIALDDAITPSRVALSLNFAGNATDADVYVTSVAAGQVNVTVYNRGASNITWNMTISAICY